MGAFDKYLNLPTSNQTTTKDIYDTAVSVYKKEESEKALQNIQAELESKTALYPKKPTEEEIKLSQQISNYKQRREEIGIDKDIEESIMQSFYGIRDKDIPSNIRNEDGSLNVEVAKKVFRDSVNKGVYYESLMENNAEYADRVKSNTTKKVVSSEKYQNELNEMLNNKEKYIELFGENNYYAYVTELASGSNKVNWGADFKYGQLQLESSLLWNEYLESGLYLDKAKAIAKDEELNQYYLEHIGELDNGLMSGTAEYLPQMGYQLKSNTGAYVLGGISGVATGLVTKSPSTGVKVGQTVTAVSSGVTSSMASYKMIRGGIYRDLIQMGVPDNIARQASSDSAFWQSIIEGVETAGSLFTLFKNPTSAPVKQKIKDYLKAYGINIVTEGLEEGSQEIVGIVYEKSALEQAGLDTSNYTWGEMINRVKEASLAGAEIAITVGGGDTTINVVFNESLGKLNKFKFKSQIEKAYNTEIEKAKTEGNEARATKLQEEMKKNTTSEKINELYNQVQDPEFQKAQKETQANLEYLTIEYDENKLNAYIKEITDIERSLRQTTDENAQISLDFEITKAQEDIRQYIKENTGKDVIFYNVQNTSATNIKEFVNATDNAIYVNDNLPVKETLALVGHGYGHYIIEQNLEVYESFKSLVTPEQIEQYKNELGYEMKPEKVMEEIFSDYIGELMATREFVDELSSKNKNIADGFKKVFKNFISNATGIEQTQNTLQDYDLGGNADLNTLSIQNDESINEAILNILAKSKLKGKANTDITTSTKIDEKTQKLLNKFARWKDDGDSELTIKRKLGVELKMSANKAKVEEVYKQLSVLYEQGMAEDSTMFSKRVNKNKLEKKNKSKYNQGRGDGNDKGRTTKNDRSRNARMERNNVESKRKIYTKREQEAFANRITKLSEEQKRIVKEVKETYNKQIIFFDDTNVNFGGGVSKNSDVIFVGINVANSYGVYFVIGHEIAEDMLLNHFDIVGEDFSQLINKIENSYNFGEIFGHYIEEIENGNVNDYNNKTDEIAKEILCDINGGRKTDESKDLIKHIRKNLEPELYKEIVDTLEKYENQIYDKNKNSKQGSFSLAEKQKLEKENTKLRAKVKQLEDKQLAVEMNAKRLERKSLNKKLENSKIKLARQTEKTSKASKEVQRVRWTVAKDRNAKKVRQNMTENREIQDRLNKANFSKDAIIAQAKSDQEREKQLLAKTEAQQTQEVNKELLERIKHYTSPKIMNRLPEEYRKMLEPFTNFYTKAGTKQMATQIKEVLKADKIKELLNEERVSVSGRLQEAVKDPEKISISSYGTLDDKVYLLSLLDEIIAKIYANETLVGDARRMDLKNQVNATITEARNIANKKALKLAEKTEKFGEKLETKSLKNKATTGMEVKDKSFKSDFRKKYTNALLTPHSMITRLAQGNPNSTFFFIEQQLQKAESRAREAHVELSKTFTDIFKDTSKEGKELRKNLTDKAEWINTKKTVVDDRGISHKLRMPRNMLMSLAMHSLNEDNIKHITGQVVGLRVVEDDVIPIMREGGGMVVPNEILYKAGKIDEAYKNGYTVKLTLEEVNELTGFTNKDGKTTFKNLTEKENEFLKATRRFYDVTTELLNEVSMELNGYKIATVRNYFPIHVAEGTIFQKTLDRFSSGLLEAMGIMNNAGFLTERTPNAFNPIKIENIASVITKSYRDVTQYYGYAFALHNNDLILHSSIKEIDDETGKEVKIDLKTEISMIDPDFMEEYNKLANFIVGTERQPTGALSKFRGLHAQFTLGANVGVWLKQALSFFPTLKYYDNYDAFLQYAVNKDDLNKQIKAFLVENDFNIDKMSKRDMSLLFLSHATKDLDYRNLGYGMPDAYDLLDNKSLFDRIKIFDGIAFVDMATVITVAKMQANVLMIEDNYEFGSAEFFTELGARVEKILRETQPDYSQVNRANIMRRTTWEYRFFSMYATPSLQLINNLYTSVLNYKYANETNNSAMKKKYRTMLVKSALGYVASAVGSVVISKLLSKILSGGEDEFSENFFEETIISMLGPTLIFDDIARGVLGLTTYEPTTPDSQALNIILNLPGDLMGLLTASEEDKPKKIRNIIVDIGQITGLPVRDIEKLVKAGLMYFADDMYKTYSLYMTPNAFKKWLANQDKDMAEFMRIYEATREKSLMEDFGYVKKSKKASEQKKQAMRRAIKSVTNKNVNEYLEIFGGYKS